MITTTRNKFAQPTVRNLSAIAIIAAFSASITFGAIDTAGADAPAATGSGPAATTVHRMVLTPTWTVKSGNGPTVSGISLHTTAKHVAVKQTAPASKISFNELIDEPIWPVVPPSPSPTPGDGSGG